MIEHARNHLIPAVLWLLAVIVPAANALAQPSPGTRLTAQVRSRTPTARSHTPMTLVWDVRWTGMELLEGSLHIVFHDGRQQLGRFETDSVVISTGRRRFETTIPLLIAENVFSQLMIDVVFVTEDRTFKLGEFPLRIQPYDSRTMTVGVSDAWQEALSAGQAKLFQSFRLERFNPNKNDEQLRTNKRDNPLITSFGHLTPAEMPANPLKYCIYNLVLLVDEGFAELQPKQLGALSAWIEAGGSVCVIPGGGLGEHHVDFLNRLAAGDSDHAPLVLGSKGRLLTEAAGNRDEIRLMQPGMGRAAVVLAPQKTGRDTNSDDWRRMVAFLWNVHSKYLAAFVRDDSWKSVLVHLTTTPDGGRLQPNFQNVVPVSDGYQKLGYVPISQGNWLLERLMPETVQVVPLGLIGLILAVYVVLIGPADYLLLGMIKQRKLTWILFPAVTVAVTVFTVWLSHWYMQPSDDRRTVEFLDIGDDGSIARRSRFELLFTSTPREVATDVSGELFAPLNQQRFRDRARQLYQQQYGYGYRGEMTVTELVGPADYAGRIPSQYTVTQQIPQWTPQINRFFSIAPKIEPVAFNWDEFQSRETNPQSTTEKNLNWRKNLSRQVQQQFGPNASAWVIAGDKVDQIIGDRVLFARRTVNNDSFDAMEEMYMYGQTTIDGESAQAVASRDFLTETCVRPRFGLFALVSRIAPTGGDNFEDLAVLDSTDPDHWLLVIAVEEDGNLLIYRKLYTKDPP